MLVIMILGFFFFQTIDVGQLEYSSGNGNVWPKAFNQCRAKSNKKRKRNLLGFLVPQQQPFLASRHEQHATSYIAYISSIAFLVLLELEDGVLSI